VFSGAPQQRPQRAKQLAKFKWLGQVIVRAMTSPLMRPPQRRAPSASGWACAVRAPQLAAHFKSVPPGNHHVQNDEIV